MGDMAKSPFLHLLSSFSFFSLNPSISKTVGGTGVTFCTQEGSDDQHAVTCQNVCKQCT